MKDVTFALGYFPSDNYKLRGENNFSRPKRMEKHIFHAINLVGYIPGLAIITGVFKAFIGIAILCSTETSHSKAFAVAWIARGILEVAGLGIAVGLLGDLPVTVFRLATMTKRTTAKVA
jgi:hypothetical protein